MSHALFFQAFGIPAGAGAAAAQVVAAVLRIGCCCLAILKDLGEMSDQCPVQKLNALGCSASSQQLVPQDFSDCSNKKRSEGSKITTAFNASRGRSRQAGPILSYAETARRWNREALAAIWTLLPPGAASLALRYACCIVAATAARSILRQASFEFGEGTAAAAGYDLQQVMLGGHAVSLWAAEISLAVVVCAASVAAVGPLLLQQVREAYCSLAAAQETGCRQAV